ncbi:hypothetical protein [Demequina sp.]|uniref:hypothetical protein n=1 Tax=Demequina sp. TaxID=2050685 RepID=UPI003D13ECCB
MNTLGDALNESFAADAGRANALDAGRMVGAIRRRRAARAAGMGTAAAVGIGAVGAVWWLAPGGRWASPAQQLPSDSCTDAELYLRPNPGALGDAPIDYRVYQDLRPNAPHRGVHVVNLDGVVTDVQPDENGDYVYNGDVLVSHDLPEEVLELPMVGEFGEQGGGGDLWDGVSPQTDDYEWTMVLPEDLPTGFDTVMLSSSLRLAMGLGGAGYDSSYVPHGAVTDEIITTTDGGTEVSRVDYGGPSGVGDDLSSVASVALRVTLATGETYTFTAQHHAVDPALLECASNSSSVTVTATGTPEPAATGSLPGSSPDPGVSQGGTPEALSGPESAVFACGALMPDELNGTVGLDVTWAEGKVPHPVESDATIDLGTGGVLITGDLESTFGDGATSFTPGWSGTWQASGDRVFGAGLYTWSGAVLNGRVVGALAVDGEDASGFGPNDAAGGAPQTDGTTLVYQSIYQPLDRLVPCGNYTQADLVDSQFVVFLGTGLGADSYEFGWIALDTTGE